MNSFPHNEIWTWFANDPLRSQAFLSAFARAWVACGDDDRTHLYPASLALIHKYGLYEEWRERCQNEKSL